MFFLLKGSISYFKLDIVFKIIFLMSFFAMTLIPLIGKNITPKHNRKNKMKNIKQNIYVVRCNHMSMKKENQIYYILLEYTL